MSLLKLLSSNVPQSVYLVDDLTCLKTLQGIIKLNIYHYLR